MSALIEWVAGATHDPLPILLTERDGVSPLDLTGLSPNNFKIKVRVPPDGAWITTGATFVILSPPTMGQINATFAAADIAAAGRYRLRVEATFTDGTTWAPFEADFVVL